MIVQPKSNPLAIQISEYYDDPLGYVLDCFPWGEGELAKPVGRMKVPGPDEWQRECLMEIGRQVKERGFDGIHAVAPIRMAISSGHDTGKTSLAAWVANWIKDTREDSQGTVTANTFKQLETKTWPAICRWAKLSVTREWWEIGAQKIYNLDRKDTWFLACQSSSEENSEAFAGQHAATSTSWYLFDEASGIAKAVWEVATGGLKDGEPMMFALGNMTRNSGEFYEAVCGRMVHRWTKRIIDSRTTSISNLEAIQEELQDYGEDSDFFRVRVRGLPPSASENQLISKSLVREAMARTVFALPDEPLVAGADIPDGGSAWFIVRFRRGLDGNVAAPIRMPGSRVDRPAMIVKLAEILENGVLCRDGRTRPLAALFIDSAFGAPIAERLLGMRFKRVQEVRFGGKPPDIHYANMRSYMWGKGVKEWLSRGCLDKTDEKLMVDLTSPGFHLNRSDAVVLESKEEMARDGRPSPDDGDAFALTFAAKVAPILIIHDQPPARRSAWS